MASFRSSLKFTRHFFWQGLLLLGVSAFAFSCGGRRPDAGPSQRDQHCQPVAASKEFAETPYRGEKVQVLSFENIRSSVNSACMRCHQAPAISGGFTYLDSFQGQITTINGETKFIPGFFEVAEKMRDAILISEGNKRMPPDSIRAKNPQAFINIGNQLNQWIQAGKTNGTFVIGSEAPKPQIGKPRPVKPTATSELGDCIPDEKIIGMDHGLDRQFETMTSLPKYLSETDLFTLDPYELAQKGTLAYNVEYPLWADNANKGRWIHVPVKIFGGKIERQSIQYDPEKKEFSIPENTRFYKTFYRPIKLANGQTQMRRMETRIIVTRKKGQEALLGTYQWDQSEQVATLVEVPYRDGSPWKDLLTDVVVDEAKGTIRPYAIPGKQRCIDCHSGSPMGNSVLGFIPLQINKRSLGAAGRTEIPAEHDLNQVQRFLSYGLLKGFATANDLPVLESSGQLPPRNIHEVRAQGYMVGNCYHCHNPGGLAFSKENGIQFAMGPGDIFGFNTQQKSVEMNTRRIVHQNGELDGSQVWRKVADPAAQQGMFSQMPMHTAGGPDCNALRLIGKWVRSFESEAAAEEFEPECKKENPFFWIDMDFTWVKSDTYVPRREDWDNQQVGMPAKYRELELSPSLQEAIQKPYAVGYWLRKPVCQFPKLELPVEEQRPWMLKDGKPKRPFGEVYFTTPGSYFYRNTCMKCHGNRADGDSSLAKGILNWSGGSVRVANFMDGMFGKKNENLKQFDRGSKNYAGNYLIWMAMGGTRVKFPPELSSILGKHGGQMLNGVREKCINQISPEKPSSPQFVDHEIFRKVCFMNNLDPDHPDLKFDPNTNKPLNPEKLEEWADRAAWNAGWAIFDFLKNASDGKWPPGNDQCEQIYPKP